MKRYSYIFIFTALGLFAPAAFAADTPAAKGAAEATVAVSAPINLNNVMISVFIIAALILLWVSFTLLNTFKVLAKELKHPTKLNKTAPEEPMDYEKWLAWKKDQPNIWTKLLQLKPISSEKSMMLEHEYDGITELDNNVPAWFNVLFYGTIIIAVLYIVNYHVLEWGKNPTQEYEMELAEASKAKDLRLKDAGEVIDEKTVKVSTDKELLATGQTIFKANCSPCHGEHGQGGAVGPNLTDEYWLHGGTINNIFKTIKYGVQEKGMISWEKQLNPKQISAVANYIYSINGSKPAGAKEPQGVKEPHISNPEAASPAKGQDSTKMDPTKKTAAL